jgi:hypothetical protein
MQREFFVETVFLVPEAVLKKGNFKIFRNDMKLKAF